MISESILTAIGAERRAQIALGFDAGHDSKHTFTHWVGILTRHIGRALSDGDPDGTSPGRFRYQMVRTAAIAIAALEALDAREKAFDPELSARKLMLIGQGLADLHQADVLVLPAGRVRTDTAGSVVVENTACCCLASECTSEERKQASATIRPRT